MRAALNSRAREMSHECVWVRRKQGAGVCCERRADGGVRGPWGASGIWCNEKWPRLLGATLNFTFDEA